MLIYNKDALLANKYYVKAGKITKKEEKRACVLMQEPPADD